MGLDWKQVVRPPHRARRPRAGLRASTVLVLALVTIPSRMQSAAPPGSADGSKLVVIPKDWKSHYPFSARFTANRSSDRVVALAATAFATDPLVNSSPGQLSSQQPHLGSFPPGLLRAPFAAASSDTFIVQAPDASQQTALRQQLAAIGATVRGYIPTHAYLVELTQAQHAALSASPAVHWIGLFQPAWRIAPKLDYIIETDPQHQLRFTALLERSTFASRQGLVAAVAATGLTVLDSVQRGRAWKVRLQGTAINARLLAALPGCLWIERFAGYQLDNNVARTSTSTATGRGGAAGPLMDVEDVWKRGLRGEGQIAAAADTGLSTGNLATLHRDFGHQDSPINPMRVIAAYALGRATWDDDQTIAGAGHGTHLSGSIVGNGLRSGADPAANDFPASSYAGTAPKSQLVFQSLLDAGGGLGGIPADLNTLFQTPYDDGARVHASSWSSPVAGAYTADAQEVDQFVWDHPHMVITASAGNDGEDGQHRSAFCNPTSKPVDGVIDDDTIGSPGTAKNNITVGASESYRPGFIFETPQGDCTSSDGIEQKTWGWFNDCEHSAAPIFSDLMADDASGLAAMSSRGPTDDGRFKPDLVAPGTAVISTRTDQNQAYQQWGTCDIPAALRPYYVTLGGSSMANALVAGAAVLARQYFADGWHGEGNAYTNLFAVPADAFDPSAALIKAALINGAFDMTPGQYGTGPTREIPPGWDSGSDLPNNAEGYGRLDLEAALFPGAGFGRDPGRDMQVHDVSPGLSTGQLTDYAVTIASGADALVVTLVWSDPYAALGAGSQLVNDLDLIVTSPSATRYWPNGIDRTSGAEDRTNNVEQVKVTAPAAGTWTVRVDGFNVPGNGEPGTTVQPYALVISGVQPPACATPAAPSGLAATPNGSNRVDLSWNPVVADSYSVHRATSPGGPYTRIASGVPSASYSDTTVSGGLTYYYVATAINEPNCESGHSPEAHATAFGDCTEPPTFAGLTAVGPAGAGGSCVLRLQWSAANSSCAGALVYNVYRSATAGFIPGPANLLQSCVTGTSFDDDTAGSGTEYHYIVRAEDAALSRGGPCQDGNQDLNTIDIAAEVGGEVTALLYADDFDGSQTPSDLWHFLPAPQNPYNSGSCAPPPTGSGPASYATDWYRQETGFCSGNSAASNNGAAVPTYSDLNLGSLVLGLPPSGGPPFVDGGIVLPTDVSTVTLTFMHDYDFESSSQNWDGGRVRISAGDWPNFTDLTPVGGYPGTVTTFSFFCTPFPGVDAYVGDSGGCVSATFDLTAFAGSRVWIAWNHGADNDAQTDSGWAIDDVRLEAKGPNPCSAPPSPVAFFTATAKDGQNRVEWQNPAAGSYGSTMVRWRTDRYPADPADGTLLVQQAGTPGTHDSATHSGLANGTTHYYAAFVDGGSGQFSAAKTVSSRPFDTAGSVKWTYATGASALAPPGIGSVYAVSNDRVVHAMEPSGASGGLWPAGWTPLVLNAPAQARPPVVPISLGAASKVAFLGSQDGRVYAVDADSGSQLWVSPNLGGLVQAAPAGSFTAFGSAHDLILVGTRNGAGDSVFDGLNLADGTIAWSFTNSIAQGGGGQGIGVISSAATLDLANRRAYFASRRRFGGSNNTVWCLSFTDNAAALVWARDLGDIDGSPILQRDRVYVGTNAGEVHALDAATGSDAWSAPFASGDGPVKGYIWPRFGSSELIFSTTNIVWSIADAGASPSFGWSIGSIPGPSVPLLGFPLPFAWIGGSDGKLYQLDLSGAVPSTSSIVLGSGAAAVGSPALQATGSPTGDMAYVGTDAGRLYAVQVPLAGARRLADPIPQEDQPRGRSTFSATQLPSSVAPGACAELMSQRSKPSVESNTTRSCSAVQVALPEQPAGGPGDRQGQGGATVPVFSATDIVDLDFEVHFAEPPRGDHLLRLRLLTPKGHLYQQLTDRFATDSTGRSGRHATVPGFPRPTSVASARREGGQGSPWVVRVRWPVAGTSIVDSSLYGAWTVEAYLDDETAPCAEPTVFGLQHAEHCIQAAAPPVDGTLAVVPRAVAPAHDGGCIVSGAAHGPLWPTLLLLALWAYRRRRARNRPDRRSVS